MFDLMVDNHSHHSHISESFSYDMFYVCVYIYTIMWWRDWSSIEMTWTSFPHGFLVREVEPPFSVLSLS